MKVVVMDSRNKPVSARASQTTSTYETGSRRYGQWEVVRDGKAYYGDTREEATDAAAKR